MRGRLRMFKHIGPSAEALPAYREPFSAFRRVGT